jgi:hypothetical protein
VARPALISSGGRLTDVAARSFRVSDAEEHEPDHTEDQDREAGGDKQKSEYRRPGLSLPRFGWRFDDLALVLCCHGGLDFSMARQDVRRKMSGQRMISDDVPGFDTGSNGSDHLKKGSAAKGTPLPAV